MRTFVSDFPYLYLRIAIIKEEKNVSNVKYLTINFNTISKFTVFESALLEYFIKTSGDHSDFHISLKRFYCYDSIYLFLFFFFIFGKVYVVRTLFEFKIRSAVNVI